ncbi:MAG: hypothetical protein PVJ34_00895 [Anaerolineae bacterium]|jgi:hypothetical protein
MSDRSKSLAFVRAAQALLYLNAAIWFILSIWSLFRLAGDGPGMMVTLLVVALLMFGNAAAMLCSGWGLARFQRRWYYLALAVVAINVVLTVTDQFGFFDLVTLLIDLLLLGLLLAIRKRYTSRRPGLAG